MTSSHPFPLGSSWCPDGINFAVYAMDADGVDLCLYDKNLQQSKIVPLANRTGNVWHGIVPNDHSFVGYFYRLKRGSNIIEEVLDPYTRGIIPRRVPPFDLYSPIAKLPTQDTFDWEDDRPPHHHQSDLIIYEMHLAGFTKDPSSEVKYPGTFLGAIEKIPYLADLGINAVELMPIFEFDPQENERCGVKARKALGNYWGYSTLNFFSPAECYATENSLNEFRELVKALHKANIEVILDVVYNHTGEYHAEGHIRSFRKLDKTAYYMFDQKGRHHNFSGCGNTFNCNHPVARRLIIDSLRYWVVDMHVDGFRFDLASIFTRDRTGKPVDASPLLEAIEDDPVLAHTRLIAEPWDAAGLYQVGSFRPNSRRWAEWNGQYRDTVRSFIKGDLNSKGAFATRICGSEDLYAGVRTPNNSINFITSHDGFSLADLVSYNGKHNEDNAEGNRDGDNNNISWNCGTEGETDDLIILARRQRQMRNFLVALMVSRGIPMLLMGDEYGHAKDGNNNTWCLDDQHNWFLWSQLDQASNWNRFVKRLIAFRKDHAILHQNAFYAKHEIVWHGLEPCEPEWHNSQPRLAFSLKDKDGADEIYVAFNATTHSCTFTLPVLPKGQSWFWVVNTSNASPHDFYDIPKEVGDTTITLGEFSSAILCRQAK